MEDRQRLGLIDEIERKRGSRVIAYITGTRPGHYDSMTYEDIRVIEHHLEEIFRKKPPSRLDLFLHTPGGYAEVPTAIVALIREYVGPKGEFSVLVPSMAFSAGTVVSLGADEIIMSPAGHIGPIDTQMGGDSVDTLRAYFDLARSLGLTSKRNFRDIFLKMTDKISPLWFGSMQRVSAESERKAMRVLATRKKPLSRKQNRRIVKFLTHEVGIHGQAIHRTEALANGIEFVAKAESYGIREAMSQLFNGYEQILELDLPLARASWRFDIPGDQNDIAIDGSYSMEKPLSLVESRDRLDIAKYAYGFRFWRDAPSPPSGQRVQGERTAQSPIDAVRESLTHKASAQIFDDMDEAPISAGRLDWQMVRRSDDY